MPFNAKPPEPVHPGADLTTDVAPDHPVYGGNRPADEALAAVFVPFATGTPDRPFVVAQLGQSLDGRIATLSGDSRYINGAPALDHLHRLRARVDAVVVGIGTVLADDPLLTVRRTPGRSPARVVIDPAGRLPPGAGVLAGDGVERIVVCGEGVIVPPGAEAIRLPGRSFDPAAIVAALGRRGFARILIEGGARTVGAFLEAGCLDRLHVLVAPVLVGSGLPGLTLAPIARIADAIRPATRAYPLGGGEVLFDCDLRRGVAEG